MKALALRQFRSLAGFAPTVLRVVLGAVYIAHGWSKVQTGPENFAGYLTTLNVPLPVVMAWVVTILEVAGGVLLIVGAFTRIVALLFVLEMIGTTLLVKVDLGFIAEQTAGAELDLAMMAGALAILFLGPGKLAIDNGIGLGDPITV
jgi:putative oxidoreductase